MIYRILILSYLSLFSTFALGEEGQAKKDFRIYINAMKTIYILPEITLDIKEFKESGYTLDKIEQITLSIIYEF